MDKNVIVRQVKMFGCAVVDARKMRQLWPSLGGEMWNHDDASLWCRQNSLDVYVDPYTEIAYFNPRGVKVPARL